MRLNHIFLMALSLVVWLSFGASNLAKAQCGPLPNTLTNGATADATQVMANFNTLLSCINTPPPANPRPALSSLTWVNQASAAATDNANGPLALSTTQNTSGNGLNALIKNVAGSSWTVTIRYALGNHIGGTNLDLAGLIVYNSGNGKIYMCGIGGGNSINVWAYNSPTSWNSGTTSKTINVDYDTIWTRAQYVSGTTSLTFSYSVDGVTWQTIFSTTTPFVGVPTGYGIAVGTQGNSAGYVVSLNYMVDTSP